jgi:hypothetical protein
MVSLGSRFAPDTEPLLIGSLFCIKHDFDVLVMVVIIWLMKNQQGMPMVETKHITTISEDKCILVSLIKLIKSLIINLMGSIWRYPRVWQP